MKISQRPRYFQVLVLALLLIAQASTVQAGDKLQRLRSDLARVKQGTLLIAPILQDSFILRRLGKPGKEAKLAAYKDEIQKANENLSAAVSRHYSFSKVIDLTREDRLLDYPSYFGALRTYDPDSFFVLQFGQALQYALGKTKRVRAYERDVLGIYSTDGKTRVYLNQGKLRLFDNPAYATSIIANLQHNLERYSRERGRPEKVAPAPLLLPGISKTVRLVEKEALFGTDSTTFLNRQWQTVVTTSELTLYRAFGGVAKPGGTFAGTVSVTDTGLTRRDLAILLAWGNTLHFEAIIEVPPGMKLNIGYAGPQDTLPGGAAQVILPYKWPWEWIKEIRDLWSEDRWTLEEFRMRYPQYFPDN